MSWYRRTALGLVGASAVCLFASPAPALDKLPETVEFNRDIRPILSDKCYTCHGPDKGNRQSPLHFDTEEGARIKLSGGKYAIVDGDPAKSELYGRISSDDAIVRMPPAYMGREKLTDREIALIRRWIEQGAKWEKHWSLIPPRKSPLPEVSDMKWPRNPIDYYVLNRLDRQGLKPSPEADRTTLIRRVTLDLTGLPPTPAEVDVVLKDTSEDAYEKLVDRLLASPRYAERMAIRWLEAARYADTNGYQSDGVRDMWRWRDWVINAFAKNMPFNQFTIEQIAGDLLPNATLEQKIATGFHRNHRTNGEGGIVPEEFRVEYVADRAETTSIVWLGLTMGCARCHDHKYDPIKQKDFYRLFAYFNSVPEKGLVYNFGNEEPFIKAPTPEQEANLKELDRRVAAAEQKCASLQPKLDQAQRKWERKMAKGKPLHWTVPEGLVAHYSLDGDGSEKIDGCADGKKDQASATDCRLPFASGRIGKAAEFDGKRFVDGGDAGKFNYLDPFSLAAWINPTVPAGAIVTRVEDYWEGTGWGLYLKDGKLRLHIILRWTDIGMRVETEEPVHLNEWQHVMATYDGRRYASGVHLYVNGQEQKLKILFDDLNYPFETKDHLRIGAGGGPENRFHGAIDDARVYKIALSPEQARSIPVLESVSELAAIPPASRTQAQSDKLHLCFLDRYAPRAVREARQQMFAARAERMKFYESIPTVMVMKDMDQPRDTFVLKRGAYDAHGEKVTPGVPAILPPLKPEWPDNRLGLARWLVDRSNPLTARVTVNRYWATYFGTGLVKTVEDFGSQGEWPVHPELLDWLAVEFMDSGWDVKKIQKTIVTSATYRQSSAVPPDLLQRDPENRLLARGPRFRLPAEVIRDQALAMSGLLAEEIGGPSVKPYQPPGLWQELAGGDGYKADKGEGLYRRSLYTYWKRTVAPPSMVNFDSPTRETCIVRQNRTNTPLQALDLMNDVTYVEASRKLAERMLTEGGQKPAERVSYGFRLATARSPKPAESRVLLDLLDHFESRYTSDSESAEKVLSEGDSPRNRKLDPKELAAYASVASVILNLDEAITKE